jgi:hypothetical protein
MSEGLNKLFLTRKYVFLQQNVISMGELKSQHALQLTDNGVQEFDLRHATSGKARIIEVIPFRLRRDPAATKELKLKAATNKSKQVTAYWLCWSRSDTSELVLADEADYFFTSQLDGCQIVAKDGGGGGKVAVTHIAGDLLPKTRTAKGDSFIASDKTARRLSSTTAYDGHPAYQVVHMVMGEKDTVPTSYKIANFGVLYP